MADPATSLIPMEPASELKQLLVGSRTAGLPVDGPALDAGCGQGRNFPLLPRPLYGCDSNHDELLAARQRYPDLDAQMFVAQMPRLPLPDDSMQTAVAWGTMYVLGGVEPARQSLADFRRVLRPGGLLYSNWRTESDITRRFAGRQLGHGTYELNDQAPDHQRGLVMSFWGSDEVVEMHHRAGLGVRTVFNGFLDVDDGRHEFHCVIAQRPS